MKYMAVKRIGDIFISLFLITLFVFPITVFIAAIRLTSKGKAIFKQIRVGRRGREFVCYKLRTMYEDAPKSIATSELCDAEKYVTPIGRFLRRTSIDELPQLYNVFKGNMSLVGPRPPLMREVSQYTDEQMLRKRAWADVRPFFELRAHQRCHRAFGKQSLFCFHGGEDGGVSLGKPFPTGVSGIYGHDTLGV